MRFLVPLLAVSLLAACGGGGDDDDTGIDLSDVTYYEDIKPILDARCAKCHYDGGIAPFPLTDYESARLYAGVAKLAIDEGIMPPWPPDDECAEYVGNRSLTDDQKAAFAAWVEQGTREGDPAAEGEPIEGDRGLTRVDRTLTMPETYTPVQSPDDYRCFVIPWPEDLTTTKYVTGFRAQPGNDKIVHHVIAFLAEPGSLAEYQAMDDAEDGPGYTCFGGTGGSAREWIGAWAPGNAGNELPPGLGLAVEPGSVVILQVHYNVLSKAPAPDQTAIELRLEDQVEREAFILPWANPRWLEDEATMKIPANDPDVMHEFAFDPTPFLGMGDAFEIHSASLHMHTLGKSGRLTIEHGNASTCLLEIDDWDFDWQDSYGFVEPKLFQRGDLLRIECHWDNSAENQPMVNGSPKIPEDVTWGEGTGDEMCLGVFLISAPR